MDFILNLGNRLMQFNQTDSEFEEIKKMIQDNPDIINDPNKCGNIKQKWKIFQVTWHFYKKPHNERRKFLVMERQFMKGAANDATAATLDKVWAMYFATKLPKYAQCIYNASQYSPHSQVRQAATWSYNSIISA